MTDDFNMYSLCRRKEVFQLFAISLFNGFLRLCLAGRLQSDYNAFIIGNGLLSHFDRIAHLRCNAHILEKSLMSCPELAPHVLFCVFFHGNQFGCFGEHFFLAVIHYNYIGSSGIISTVSLLLQHPKTFFKNSPISPNRCMSL